MAIEHGCTGKPLVSQMTPDEMDGDDWSRNNVVTGGAGAIGYRVPRKAELAEEIAELEAEYNRLTGA